MAPSKIIIHSDWNSNVASHDADIAMLIIDDDIIQYAKYVKPVCLLDPSFGISSFQEGVVVGWGKQSSGPEDIKTPRKLTVPILTNEQCFLKNPKFATISSERTFCAGHEMKGAGVCNGDSGGGLFVVHQGKYFLLGIVSASFSVNGECDVNTYALYTNVNQLLSWIESFGSNTQQPIAPVAPFIQHPIPIIQQNVPTIQQVKPSFLPQSNFNQIRCGLMDETVRLAGDASISSRNQWPWMVVFSRVQSNGQLIHGTGTIISIRHVLATVCGCITERNVRNEIVPANPQAVSVFVGITSLQETINSPNRLGVGRIVINPYFVQGAVLKGNLAIVTLLQSLKFGNNVRPICLWSQQRARIAVSNAFIVGYETFVPGRNDISAPVKKHLPLLFKQCPRDYQGLLTLNPSSYVCASSFSQQYQCVQSSHQSYVQQGNEWFVNGLMAFYAPNPVGVCNSNQPYVFEDISLYNSWIMSELARA